MKNSKKKNVLNARDAWITLAIAVLVGVGIILRAEHEFKEEERKMEQSEIRLDLHSKAKELAWVEIDFGDKKRRFEGMVDGTTYSFEIALQSVAEAGKFTFRSNGEKINSVDGIGKKGRWVIYRNGTVEKKPLNALTIASGDTYTLRYVR